MSSPRLIQAIKQDHHAILSLHEQYGNNEQQLAELTWKILRHSFAEEIVLHPLYVDHLKDGKQIAEQDRKEHAALKDPLLQLASGEFGPGSPEHTLRLAELIHTLSTHFTEEERDDLPRLENAISETVSTDAASKFLGLLRFPKPPYATLADLLSAPTDKIKAELSKSLPSGSERRATIETKN